MNPFEDELRRALRRVDPPAGFAGRVMARLGEQAPAGARGAEWPSLWTRFQEWAGAWSFRGTALGLAATAAVVIMAVSVAVWRQHRIREEQRQGEIARAQVMQALRITSVKLRRVSTRVRKATQDGIPVGDRAGRPRPEASLNFELPILD